MGMTIDKAIIRYKNNAEYERTHGNLQGCLEFRQLAEWLEKYQKITKIVNHWVDVDLGESPSLADTNTIEEIIEVLEDGKDN